MEFWKITALHLLRCFCNVFFLAHFLLLVPHAVTCCKSPTISYFNCLCCISAYQFSVLCSLRNMSISYDKTALFLLFSFWSIWGKLTFFPLDSLITFLKTIHPIFTHPLPYYMPDYPNIYHFFILFKETSSPWFVIFFPWFLPPFKSPLVCILRNPFCSFVLII